MKAAKISLKPQQSLFDIPLVTATTILVITGLVIIYDATVVAAYRDFSDSLYYFKNQLVWASLGAAAMGFFSFFDYHKLIKIAPFFLGLALILLILVLIPGIGTQVYGARRWLNIAGFTLQPSELAKLALIFYSTYIIAKFANYKIKLIDAAVVLFLPAAVVCGLVLAQPDLGTTLIIIATTLIIYFTGGAPIGHFFLALPAVAAAASAAIISQPYRLERLKSFLDPTHDPQGASYQIYQILIALAQGGIFGVGLGGSRAKFAFIPEVHSDAILAVFIEELGFVGAIFLIALFLFLIKRAITCATGACDFQGKILALGIAGLIATQTFFNLASIVALVPLTGVPLPFISYGGSSLFITMSAIGVLLNIKRQS